MIGHWKRVRKNNRGARPTAGDLLYLKRGPYKKEKNTVNKLRHFLQTAAVPVVALFVVMLTISEIQGRGAVEALRTMWSFFRVFHYIPQELATNILGELFDVSSVGAAVFFVYSYLAPLMYLWAMLCFEALRHAQKKETEGFAVSMLQLPSRRQVKNTIPMCSVLSAVGQLPFVRVLMVLIVASFVYLFVWLLLCLVAILIGAIPAIGKEWAVVSASTAVSGFFIYWAYNLYPTESVVKQNL